jgi:hypothetical protein
MPSVSKRQADLMRAVAHSPEFAAKVNIPVSVGREFYNADQAKRRRGSIKKAMADAAAKARGGVRS